MDLQSKIDLLKYLKKTSFGETPCTKVESALQYRYPLCWMMSVVGLLNNLIILHEVDFLHPDVVAFVTDWKGKPVSLDPSEESCPLIRPQALRKYTDGFLQSNLNKVEVTVFRDPKKMQYLIDNGLCFRPSDLRDSWKTWFSDRVRLYGGKWKEWFLSSMRSRSLLPVSEWEFSRESALSDKPQAHYFSNVPSETTITAEYTDPVVQDYLSGKQWYYGYPVCVSKFVGGKATGLLESLLSYKNTVRHFSNIYPTSKFRFFPEADIAYALSHQMQWSRSANPSVVVFDASNFRFSLFRFLEGLSKTSFLNTGYIFLGGVLTFRNPDLAHAIHFVACDSSVTFVDPNFDKSFKFSDIQRLYMNKWKKNVAHSFLKQYAHVLEKADAALIFKCVDKCVDK